jgi:hypothetical protein
VALQQVAQPADVAVRQRRACHESTAALGVGRGVAGDGPVNGGGRLIAVTIRGPSRGSAQVISSAFMPVRARLSAHPTLAAGSPLSFAIAMMWHCGLPSMRSAGKAFFSVMRASPEIRSSTTSGPVGMFESGP